MQFFLRGQCCLTFALAALLLGALPTPIRAQSLDEVPTLPTMVVSATRTQVEQKKVASSVTIITAEEIAQSKQPSVEQVLRGVPGVDVVRTGGRGGNSSVFLRGANSEHTLVLIDGIEVNNPATNSRQFNFADLTLDNIERIEVLRGPQSIYGSDAIGGVIAIYTKKGSGDVSGFASAEAGSFDSFVGKAGVNTGTDSAHVSLEASYNDTEGVSAADTHLGNTEKDGYKNGTIAARFGITPIERLDLNFSLRYTDSESELDNRGGVGGDDPNRGIMNEQFFFRTTADVDVIEDRFVQVWGFSYTNQKFHDDNDPDAAHPGEFQRSDFKGILTKYDLQNKLTINENYKALLGVEREQETASSIFQSDGPFGPFESEFLGDSTRTTGVYGEVLADISDNFFTTAGIRWDHHSRVNDKVTYRIAPSYQFDSTGTRFVGNVGTGFKAPTLFQLFSSFGNPELESEKSFGWELGVEQEIDTLETTFGATYFWSRIEDLISFNDQTFVLENIAEAKINGVEAFARTQMTEDLSTGLEYTYTRAIDEATDMQLLRRPQHKFSAFLNYAFLEQRGNVLLKLIYTGSRADNNFDAFPPERVTLDKYTLLNLAASFEINDTVEVFGRIDNILDERYQEVFGYGTPGIGAFAGARLNL